MTFKTLKALKHECLYLSPHLANDSNLGRCDLVGLFLFNWIGGDPAYVLAGLFSNQEQIDSIRAELGLDQPLAVQLWILSNKLRLSTSATVGPQVSRSPIFLQRACLLL